MPGADDVARSVGELSRQQGQVLDALSGAAGGAGNAAHGFADFFRSTDNLLALVVCVVLLVLNLHGTVYSGWTKALRYGAFQVVSVGTSTGFATTDSNVWPPFAQLVLIFFILQCACSGSTSGGIKADRMVLLWHAIKKRIVRIEHPHAVVKAKIDYMAIDNDVLEASILFIVIYVGIVFLSSLFLTILGVDILTSFSA